jgi:hypothetical protein
MENFEFIADEQYRSLLKRDFIELQNCVENKASKSVLILSGSIIETILLEFFSHNLPNGVTKAQLLRKNLGDLIDNAESINLISQRSKELSVVIKNYRNLIHPGREIRTNEKFDFETAIVSFSLVKIILKEIKENYLQKYGYTSEDIYNKIIVDNSTYSIYEKLILKLNEHEKVKLISLLVEYEIENYEFNDYAKFIKYIKPLKKVIERKQLLVFCKRLLKEVEKGKKQHIYALFEIFGEDLAILQEEEKELILTYIYNKVEGVSAWNNEIENSRIRELFSFLGLYIHSPELKQKFFDLLINIVRYHNMTENTKWYYTSTYRNMISKFSEIEQDKCKIFIKDNVQEEVFESFYKELEDDLPF